MTAIRRLITTVLATVGTVAGLLVTAALAAAAPAPVNDGNTFTGPVPQGPATTPSTTIVNSGSPWWTFVLVAAAAVAVTLLVIRAVSRMHRHAATAQLAH
jgi:hypothetical protein